MLDERPRENGPSRGPGGRADGRTLPAQAQVAAWVQPVRTKRKGPSRFLRFWAKTEEIKSGFAFFFFQKIEKMEIGSKEKFSLWAKFIKLNVFPLRI